MILIIYGLLITHFMSYKNYYIKIGMTFSITYLMKRLIKSAGNKEHADIIGLTGYVMTFGEFTNLMKAIKDASNKALNSEDANKIIGGLLGDGLETIKELFNNAN